ncbi:MAG TPA: DUF58 domain-containing protein [Pirellulales bacterium]|nr:DUF58 domain-containing protein [Pirellulales bacterium]
MLLRRLSVRSSARSAPRTRYRISLTFEGWCYLGIAAFILAGAITRQINLLMILFGMLAGAMVMCWRIVKKMLRKIEVRRRLPDSISAGDLLVVEFTAVNRRRRLPSWALEITDRIVRESSGRRRSPLLAQTLVSYLPAGQSRTASYRGRLVERGRYRFGPLQVSARFPLGLFHYRMITDQYDSLIVFPRVGRLLHGWKRLEQAAEAGSGKTSRRQGLHEGEFYGLRDWRSGDSRRWLHWRTSARRQTPVVRQFEQQRHQDLAVVLDLWQPDQPRPDQADAVELAVSFVATVVADLCRGGGRWLYVAANGREPWLESGPTSTAMLHEVMRRLALSEPASRDDLQSTLSNVLDRIRRGTQVVVVSTHPVYLNDQRRFGEIWRDPRRRAWLTKVRTFDTGDASLGEFFRIE